MPCAPFQSVIKVLYGSFRDFLLQDLPSLWKLTLAEALHEGREKTPAMSGTPSGYWSLATFMACANSMISSGKTYNSGLHTNSIWWLTKGYLQLSERGGRRCSSSLGSGPLQAVSCHPLSIKEPISLCCAPEALTTTSHIFRKQLVLLDLIIFLKFFSFYVARQTQYCKSIGYESTKMSSSILQNNYLYNLVQASSKSGISVTAMA